MSSSVVDVIDEVRARVGANSHDRVQVRHLVEDVLAETVSTSENFDIDTIADHVVGFGSLQPLLDDPGIEEIWINDPSHIFIARSGRTELTSIMMTADEIRSVVERMLASSGRRIDISNPFVDATLPDGSRLHVAIPDITRNHWSVNIRKFVMGSKSLESLVAAEALTTKAADFLVTCIESGKNIVVAGATQAGKTTLMNALLNSASALDRIITCEEVFELQLTSPDWVALQTRQASLEGGGEIPLRRLIKEALRMRPTRLVVGEVRQEECLDLLVAMNSGMPSMCSIHANSARETLKKLCLLPMLAGNNVAADFVIPTVASVVDIVVYVRLDSEGKRGISTIAEVSGRVEDGVIEMHEVFSRVDGELVRR